MATPMINFSLRLKPEEYRNLTEVAEEQGYTRTGLATYILRKYIKDHPRKLQRRRIIKDTKTNDL